MDRQPAVIDVEIFDITKTCSNGQDGVERELDLPLRESSSLSCRLYRTMQFHRSITTYFPSFLTQISSSSRSHLLLAYSCYRSAHSRAKMPPKRKAVDAKPDPHQQEGDEIDVVEAKALTDGAAKRRKVDDKGDMGAKHIKPEFADRTRYKDSKIAEENGIIPRKFYPPEMTQTRAKQYATGEIERPFTALERVLKETKSARAKVDSGKSVVHWYKNDLRVNDNKSLRLASDKAKSKNIPLICVYIVSPQDFEAHFTAAVRVDFILRNLEHLKSELAKLDIPLYVEAQAVRKKIPSRLIELFKEWNAQHVFCNIEYEVDELRREARLVQDCLDEGIAFEAVHDSCVVEPGPLKTNAGGQISVYSPWHRKWCAHITSNPDALKDYGKPAKNPPSARDTFGSLFAAEIPPAPQNKTLNEEEKKRYGNLWPVGEAEANTRLQKFIETRISKYHENRNLPAANHTSSLSAHLATGTLAARTAVREALKAAKRKAPTPDRDNGTMMWIGEVAWRDFYKHVLAAWPYICMNVPFKPEYNNIEWEYDDDNFKAWTEGRTGYPLIDAAMRQVHHMAYMHNRVRMNVASFLAKHLMIDWRMGERWFMEHLIDGDFASNNGGWGFSASCGVDPQPYFRIFNPLLQSEKFDEAGDYIRKWVPELRDVTGKAIHDPYNRGAGAIASKNGYPKMIVEHKFARDRCLTRYKEGIGRSTA